MILGHKLVKANHSDSAVCEALVSVAPANFCRVGFLPKMPTDSVPEKDVLTRRIFIN